MIKCDAERFQSGICIEAFRACVTHAESGLAVGAEAITPRLATRMSLSKYRSMKPA